MSAAAKLMRLEDDVAFEPGRHHPLAAVAPPDKYYDEPEATGESASEAFFLWLKAVTHEGDLLCRKEELAARVVALLYLLDGGDKAIAQLSFESGVAHSKIHRRIAMLSAKTGIKIPHRKKARSVGGTK